MCKTFENENRGLILVLAPSIALVGQTLRTFRVQKMRFVTKGDKSHIQYNASITISGIPARAYEYMVNGKSAIVLSFRRVTR